VKLRSILSEWNSSDQEWKSVFTFWNCWQTKIPYLVSSVRYGH